jgi:uncharacterized membrane protein
MTILILGLVLFLGIHSMSIVARGARESVIATLGEGGWKGLYSALALVGLALIVVGYGFARQQPVVLFDPPRWTKHLALLLMMPVFPLLIAAYTQGRIKRATKHPMLLATKLWAFAHLLANGTLADVLLFGGFLVWGVLDRISLRKRGANPVVSPPKAAHDLIAVGVGLALYAWVLLQGHAWIIGVSPIAR